MTITNITIILAFFWISCILKDWACLTQRPLVTHHAITIYPSSIKIKIFKIYKFDITSSFLLVECIDKSYRWDSYFSNNLSKLFKNVIYQHYQALRRLFHFCIHPQLDSFCIYYDQMHIHCSHTFCRLNFKFVKKRK